MLYDSIGKGKSWHICAKISATLTSTGTPTFFLHPSKVSHGDLGMISEGDIQFVLSWLGNAVELVPMLSYANRLACSDNEYNNDDCFWRYNCFMSAQEKRI